MTDPIKKRKKKKQNKKKRIINISASLLKKLLNQPNQNSQYKNPMYTPQGITYYGGLSGGSIPINNSVLNKPAYEFGSLTERLARPAILPAPEPVLEPLKPSPPKPPTKKDNKMKLPLGVKPPSKQHMKDFLSRHGIKTKSNATTTELHALMRGLNKFKNPDKPKQTTTEIFADPVQEESKRGFDGDNEFESVSDISDVSTHVSYPSVHSAYENYENPISPSIKRNNLSNDISLAKDTFVSPKKTESVSSATVEKVIVKKGVGRPKKFKGTQI